MKGRISILCLAIAVFLGSAGVAWSADFQTGQTAYERRNYATALQEWTPLAEQGNADAQRSLGEMYRQGNGVRQNYKTAAWWFRLAAEQGDAPAQVKLGEAYSSGNGVPLDNMYAYMWWNIAASSGDKGAVKNRDKVAKRMNSNQIETAQKLARECVRKKYKGC